ncbi:hypothetical protein CUMW_285730, partial [Citrus unshiu]
IYHAIYKRLSAINFSLQRNFRQTVRSLVIGFGVTLVTNFEVALGLLDTDFGIALGLLVIDFGVTLLGD